MDRTRSGDWLFADALIRNLGRHTSRTTLSSAFRKFTDSLQEHPWRWSILGGETPILFWLHRENVPVDPALIIHQAEVGALAAGTREIQVIRLSIGYPDKIVAAHATIVKSPPIIRADYHDMLAEAEASKRRTATAHAPDFTEAVGRDLNRNDKCWCGSGEKLKKLHGRYK
ncbi:SEC-C metal-binding domain-containing protein [Geomonas subterranea]|uniref:SEC-C metal-binding domain-containing protein n=1 Tax=Geomonas subterranea TaxID=2847989 RepID=UPI001CD7B664|nr:SEC-C metal-binding domain-containing protein [Geomonas fuzhouensis]